MSEYEEEVLKYCRTRILPEGYKIDADLRRKVVADRRMYEKIGYKKQLL